MPSQPIRAIIAVRVSSERQMTEGFGHVAQLEALPRLVRDRGWQIARRPDGSEAIYDEGFASTTPQAENLLSIDHRPVMQALLAELPETRPDYVVCCRIDRIARDEYEHSVVVNHLVRCGVRGFAEAPELSDLRLNDLSDPQQRAFSSITAAIAALEKATMKTRLRSGSRVRTERDRLPNGGHPPYGYARQGKRDPLAINEAEADTYRLMVQLVLDNGWGAAKIAHELIKRGIPTRSGTPTWGAATVRRILLNKSQAGYMRVKDGWLLAAGQEAIISEADWRRMQGVLDSRPKEHGTNQRRRALAGLLRCGVCNKTLKAQRNSKVLGGTKRTYLNYTCKIYNSGCVGGYSISEKRALAELGDWVDARLAATDWRDDLSASRPDLGTIEARISALSQQATQAQRKMEKAYSAYIDADDTDTDLAHEEYLRRKKTTEDLRAELDQAQAHYGAAQTAAASVERPSLEELRAILEDWQSFPDNEKRMTLEVVIEKAIVGPPGKGPRLTIVPAVL
jgi:DNA invertase Pin-like site-specific DNA recombinase